MPISKNRKNHKEKVAARGASRAEFRRLYQKEINKVYAQQMQRWANMAEKEPEKPSTASMQTTGATISV